MELDKISLPSLVNIIGYADLVIFKQDVESLERAWFPAGGRKSERLEPSAVLPRWDKTSVPA